MLNRFVYCDLNLTYFPDGFMQMLLVISSLVMGTLLDTPLPDIGTLVLRQVGSSVVTFLLLLFTPS